MKISLLVLSLFLLTSCSTETENDVLKTDIDNLVSCGVQEIEGIKCIVCDGYYSMGLQCDFN